MKLDDGRNIVLTFQVCDVKVPILSVGKFCGGGNEMHASFDRFGGQLVHETAGKVKVENVKNHYAMKCWVGPFNGKVVPISFGGSSCSGGRGQVVRDAGQDVHGADGGGRPGHSTVPARTDAEVQGDLLPRVRAPATEVEEIDPEIVPVKMMPSPQQPSKEEI